VVRCNYRQGEEKKKFLKRAVWQEKGKGRLCTPQGGRRGAGDEGEDRLSWAKKKRARGSGEGHIFCPGGGNKVRSLDGKAFREGEKRACTPHKGGLISGKQIVSAIKKKDFKITTFTKKG